MAYSTSDAIRKAHPSGCVIMTEDKLASLRKLLLMMLTDIDSTAKKNGIEYQLGGGSVLGAVRHKGFIPWDDDIDINITRKECYRLMEAMEKDYPDKYSYLIPGVTPGYMLLFPQIRLNGTSVRTRDDFNNSKCGVCIDLFIIENTYNSPVRRFFHGIGCQYYGFKVSAAKFRRDREFLIPFAESTGDVRLLKTIRRRIIFASLFARGNPDRITDKADKWNGRCSDDDSVFVTVPSGRRHFWGEKRKRSVFFPPSYREFEGKTYACPNNIDQYLTTLYGDYSRIPEDSEKESHIFIEPFSLG